jgi:transcriptional regulator with XRE-family HTH domain
VKKNLGKKIKQVLLDSGLRQKDLSKKTGITQQLLNDWVNKRRNPKIENLEKIAKALNTPIGYFLDDSPSQYVGNKNKNVTQVMNSNSDLIKEIEILTLKLQLKEKENKLLKQKLENAQIYKIPSTKNPTKN